MDPKPLGVERKRAWIFCVGLLTVLVVGSAARIYNLNALSFYYDEAENALVARTWLQTGHCALPSGVPAPNGLLYKWVTAQLFRVAGEAEWIARLPAAVSGVATALVLFLWGQRWYGLAVGWTAGMLYAVWPWTVTWGRIGRHYGFQQLLFLMLVIITWKIFSAGDPASEQSGGAPHPRLRKGHLFLLVCVMVLLILTSLTSAFAVAFLPVFALGIAIYQRVNSGTWSHSTLALWFTTLSLIGACLIGLVAWWLAPTLLSQIWQNTRNGDWDLWFYPEFLRSNFGLIFVVLVMTGFFLSWKEPGRAILLATAVGVPWVLHTLVVPFYRPRFLYYVFPVLLLWQALALTRFGRSLRPSGKRQNWATIATTSGALILLLMSGRNLWMNTVAADRSTAAIVNGSPYTLAREVADIRGLSGWAGVLPDGAKVVSTDAALAHYYFGRCDYLYPWILPDNQESHYNMLTPDLRNADELRHLLDGPDPVLVVVTLRKLKALAARFDGGATWDWLLANASRSFVEELAGAVWWDPPPAKAPREEPPPEKEN